MNADSKNEEPELDAYVWDGSGSPDPDVQQLEGLLAEYRYVEPVKRSWGKPLAIAAVLLVAVGAAAFFLTNVPEKPEGWLVTWTAGGEGATHLALGKTFETGEDQRARIAIGEIGHVDLDPLSRVKLVRADADEHRLDLDRGTLHAVVTAPPRLFVVGTPAATAVDLGCAYTLEVSAEGAGLLHVTAGYVELVAPGKVGFTSFVPSGASCRMRKGEGPGIPYFGDAPEALQDVKADSTGALTAAMSAERAKDTLTLFHLLPRVDDDSRSLVAVRIAELVPLPEGVTQSAIESLDESALAAWQEALSGHW